MPYRKRSYRSKRSTLRGTVKKTMLSLAESKYAYRDQPQSISLTLLNTQVGLAPFDMLGNVVAGSRPRERTGNSIQLRGFRCSMTYDNSVSTADAPAYITTLVLMVKDTVANSSIHLDLFRGHRSDTVQGVGPVLTAAGEWRSDVHTTPINTAKYTVLHRSSLRLGCKEQPDLPGPRYAQRVMYIPVNKTVTFPKTAMTDDDQEDTSPRFIMLNFITNPTRVVATSTATVSVRSEITAYYKDI